MKLNNNNSKQCEFLHNYNNPYERCYFCRIICCRLCIHFIYLKPPKKASRKMRQEAICDKCKEKWEFLNETDLY